MNNDTSITERQDHTMRDSGEQQIFKSLDDIDRRKCELLKSIRKDQKEISKYWNEIFKPQQKRSKQKGFKLSTLLNSSVGVIDGALFAWKLYRKFKR